MLVHSVLPRSAANGPGERAVVWFQGCDLRCPGCWNESTHAFDRRRDRSCDLNHKMAPSAILSFVTAATPHAQHFSEMAFYDNWGSF